MKSFYWLPLLGCAVLLHSCNSDLSGNGSLSDEARELTFTAPDFKYAPSSRTNLTISNEGAEFSWSANDTVGIFPNEGTQVGFSMAAGAGTKTASFDGGGWSLKSASTYAAYYPLRGEFYLDKRAIPLDYTGQTQTGNASTAHLGAYDYMGAVAKTPEEGRVTFGFQHLGALVRLNLPVPDACTLTSVVLRSNDTPFITKGSLDLTSPSLAVTSQERSHEYMISLKDISFTESNQTATIYFMLSPVDLSGKNVNVTVTCDGAPSPLQYIFAGQNFKSGLAYSMVARPNTPAEAVDLGLPSGVKWASYNIGAMKPEEYGGYYAWGETEEKEDYTTGTYLYYKYISGDPNENQNWPTNSSQNWINIGSEISGTEYDVAHVKWGGSWRMPTETEIKELVDNCICTWTTYNGVKGEKFVGPNGNSIFLPAAGERAGTEFISQTTNVNYWAGTFGNYGANNASYLCFFENGGGPYYYGRFYGFSVRPVSD